MMWKKRGKYCSQLRIFTAWAPLLSNCCLIKASHWSYHSSSECQPPVRITLLSSFTLFARCDVLAGLCLAECDLFVLFFLSLTISDTEATTHTVQTKVAAAAVFPPMLVIIKMAFFPVAVSVSIVILSGCSTRRMTLNPDWYGVNSCQSPVEGVVGWVWYLQSVHSHQG